MLKKSVIVLLIVFLITACTKQKQTTEPIEPTETALVVESTKQMQDTKSINIMDLDVISIENVDSLQVISELYGHEEGWGSGVDFSPDGRLLVTTADDAFVKLWDIVTGMEIASFKMEQGGTDVIFSPDGSYVLSACMDKTAYLWDISSGELIRKYTGHGWGLNSVVIDPSSKWVAASGNDGTIRIWDFDTADEIAVLTEHGGVVNGLAVNESGELLASSGIDKSIRVWDTNSFALAKTLKGSSRTTNSVTFSPDSSIIASGNGQYPIEEDLTVHIWDIETETEICVLENHKFPVTDVHFSGTGDLLFSVSPRDALIVWNADTCEQLFIENEVSIGFSLAISPRQNIIALSGWDGVITLLGVP